VPSLPVPWHGPRPGKTPMLASGSVT